MEIKKKKPVNGKAKGNTFENTIAKLLCKELSPLKFIRTPGSGARIGGVNFEKFGEMFGEESMKIFCGDVTCTNDKQNNLEFKHSIECKSYKESDSFEIFVKGTSKVFEWFNESIVDAKKTNRIPLLIFKWNRTSTFLAMRRNDNENELKLKPRLSLEQNDLLLDIFYLEDVLPYKNFWYKELKNDNS